MFRMPWHGRSTGKCAGDMPPMRRQRPGDTVKWLLHDQHYMPSMQGTGQGHHKIVPGMHGSGQGESHEDCPSEDTGRR